MSGQKTATRTTLTAEWQEQQKLVDWMHAPLVADYVNRLVSGRALHEDGHWAIYARDQHLSALAKRRGRKLSMLSLACGSGHIEEALIREFEWPVDRFVGLEYDAALRTAAGQRFRQLDGVESRFEYFDFNATQKLDLGRFDVIYTCHSIHHASDIEGMMAFINRSMASDGLMMGIDFFGPSRFQIEPEALELVEEMFAALPPHLRRDLTTGEIDETFRRATIAEVRDADPSESPRSSDLRTLLFSTFPIIETKPMGGTLLRWLLQYRAGNFDAANPSDVGILKLLMMLERKFMELRAIRSDDLFFVLGKSDRI